MKNIYIIFFSFSVLFISCNQNQNEERDFKVSSGKINSVSIFIDDALWNREVGDSIRAKLAAPVDGLPQEEPIFNINQHPTKVFNGLMTNFRNILVIQKGTKSYFKIIENEFVQNQSVIYISGRNIPEILNLIEVNLDSIVSIIKKKEITENQKIINASLLNDTMINQKFKLSLGIPSSFKYIFNSNHFLWIKKEILSGNSSILVYEIPFSSIKSDSSAVSDIIRIRDSIGSLYIHGKLENTNMSTEESYSPYLLHKTVDGKKAYETRGTWEVKNDFMSGPFINYAIDDSINKRIIVIEGFVYAPSTPKRDLIHELEAIIKSVKVLK